MFDRIAYLSCLVVSTSILLCSPAHAATDAPPKIQAVVLNKVFAFDKSLRGKEIKVIACYNEKTRKQVDAVAAEFEKIGVSVIKATIEELVARIDEANVVYTLSNAAQISDLCADRGILSTTGDGKLVENGKLTIGIVVEGGKPAIWVNLNQAKAEKQTFAVSLLKLSRVIRS